MATAKFTPQSTRRTSCVEREIRSMEIHFERTEENSVASVVRVSFFFLFFHKTFDTTYALQLTKKGRENILALSKQ
jgi:hypothetical protein